MAEDEGNVAADFGAEPDERRKRHPVAVFFHLAFRVGALVAYLFLSIFGVSTITQFLIVVLLSAFDFWTVKNVTGRLLVGLRWWNKVDEDGKSDWVFESRKDGRQPLLSESRIFWGSLFICPVLWLLFSVIALLPPSTSATSFMISLVGLCFTGSNLYGYVRCAQGKTSLRAAATQYLGRRVLEETLASKTAAQSTTASA
eukprot:scpid35638/ scgid11306/ Protein FAM18B1